MLMPMPHPPPLLKYIRTLLDLGASFMERMRDRWHFSFVRPMAMLHEHGCSLQTVLNLTPVLSLNPTTLLSRLASWTT